MISIHLQLTIFTHWLGFGERYTATVQQKIRIQYLLATCNSQLFERWKIRWIILFAIATSRTFYVLLKKQKVVSCVVNTLNFHGKLSAPLFTHQNFVCRWRRFHLLLVTFSSIFRLFIVIIVIISTSDDDFHLRSDIIIEL